ncbi:hypothetical protein F5Y10DRAFT_256210 [Nemania abortiva]|nr:hypothetical protein F5Y10DRAFT_256210 [Nemania abortiva]
METPPNYQALKAKYLRQVFKSHADGKSIDGRIRRLWALTKSLAQCDNTDEKVRLLCSSRGLTELVELEILCNFGSWEGLVRGLESFFPAGIHVKDVRELEPQRQIPSRDILASSGGRFDDNFSNGVEGDVQKSIPCSLAYLSAKLESTEGCCTTNTADNTTESTSISSGDEKLETATNLTNLSLSSGGLEQEGREGIVEVVSMSSINPLDKANSEPCRLLCGVGVRDPVPLAAQGNVQRRLTGNNGFLEGSLDSSDECVIDSREELGLASEETRFCCITEGRIQGSSDLSLHRGSNSHICRWKPGSLIKYSIDYDSFVAQGSNKKNADYALRSLKKALGKWNMLKIGVEFEYVDPGTSSIAFELKYFKWPQHAPFNILESTLATSFFPVDIEDSTCPLPLYIFSTAFKGSYRPFMTRVFLHEGAHILGGRHENAATAEKNDASVQLGNPNDQSVLVTGRHPKHISLHRLDAQWFSHLMALPAGSNVDGFPIRDVTL